MFLAGAMSVKVVVFYGLFLVEICYKSLRYSSGRAFETRKLVVVSSKSAAGSRDVLEQQHITAYDVANKHIGCEQHRMQNRKNKYSASDATVVKKGVVLFLLENNFVFCRKRTSWRTILRC